MISEYDQPTRVLIGQLTPQWSQIRTATRRFSKIDDTQFVSEAVLFVGRPSLYCCMWTKDFGDDVLEYYPIYLKIVDEKKYAPEEWITLARKSGTAELDRKLQWLFETPSLSLTEGIESFTDWPSKEDSKETSFCFYNGLDVKDPQGPSRLRIMASNKAEFTVTLTFAF